MSKVYTTEITSDQIASDNPLHQRLLKPYVVVGEWLKGDVLEVGCGEGRGVGMILGRVNSYSAVDKIEEVIERLKSEYPSGNFVADNIPPLKQFKSDSFDFVISFQVIEHINDDAFFLREIHRVLKPGGKLFLTTPNRPMSLSRNPWHIREYTAEELTNLGKSIFSLVEMKGITGDEKVMAYYEQNKESVNRIMRYDIFNLQHRLPASVLKVPYEILNRWNRNKLKNTDDKLVSDIGHENYLVTNNAKTALDLFLIATK